MLFPSFLLVVVLSCSISAQQTAFITNTNTANGGSPQLVSNFQPNRQTPGNVGLALSGGGSIALSNSMGILRGLRQLGLDTQIKAISTASGGTWATAPYTFLPPSIDDDTFLGKYVANPGDLTLTALFNSDPSTVLTNMDQQCLGYVPTQLSFSGAALAARAAVLYAQGVPADRLWSRLIAENVLEPFGLSSFQSNNCPSTGICSDDCATIASANPSVQFTSMRQGRPLHIMNTAMFVTSTASPAPSGFLYLAPVQSTAWTTGIISTPPATYSANGQDVPVGGGGISTFAFNSEVSSVSSNGNTVSVTLQDSCPFGLSDITGASSAAFAEVMQNNLNNIADIDPQFSYWPAGSPQNGAGSLTRFSDGGTLENTGVASLLTYGDIDNIISVVYATTPISMDSNGIIILDGEYPSLFGMQKYQAGVGYTPFPADTTQMSTGRDTEYRYNQVFDSSYFQTLLNGLYAASTNNGASSAGTGAPVFLMQNVPVVDNAWFGVQGGRTVNVLFVYMNAASSWTDQLSLTVQGYMALNLPDFPQLNFFDTYQPAINVNLLAHFASWIVTSQSTLFQAMFNPNGPASFLEQNGDSMSAAGSSSGGLQRTRTVIFGVAYTFVGVMVILAIALIIRRRQQRNYSNLDRERELREVVTQ